MRDAKRDRIDRENQKWIAEYLTERCLINAKAAADQIKKSEGGVR